MNQTEVPAQPFIDTFSRQSRGVWTITVDDEVTQLTQLATALGQSDVAARLSASEGAEPLSPKNALQSIGNAVTPAALREVKADNLPSFANLYVSVLYQALPAQKQYEQPLLALVDAIAQMGAPTGTARYHALAAIFNSLPADATPALMQDVLVRILRLAASEAANNATLDTLRPVLLALPTSLQAWNASSADEVMRMALAISERDPQFSYSLLQTYFAQSTSPSQELQLTQLALALRLPNVFLAPPTGLPASAPEVTLANAVVAGDVQAITSVPERCGPAPALVSKARSVAIARYLATRVGKAVSYDEMTGHLVQGTSDDDMVLEEWIIDAVKSGLISARLSQPRREISVLNAQPPSGMGSDTGAPGDWRELRTRLQYWKESVDRMVGVLRGNAVPEAVNGDLTAARVIEAN